VHHLKRAEEIVPRPAYEGKSRGFARAPLVDREAGSVHMGFGLSTLEAGGEVERHLHSFEESFYVLAGTPTLVLDRQAWTLEPGACGIVPVAVPHAWLGADDAESRWLDMAAPQPRGDAGPPDTFFVGGDVAFEPAGLDLRDPRARHVFKLRDEDMKLDALKVGAPVDAPAVSASMATALLAYSGIAVKMLVDQRLDAQLSSMFMVEYQPGGVAQPHDHPLEEAYYMLEGETVAVADGVEYLLRPGDCFWTGVGCIHAFYNRTDGLVRWLETQAPQPPARHSYRFNRDWDYLASRLAEPD
jgi:quercetin dioxygenase-like cupin family protein